MKSTALVPQGRDLGDVLVHMLAGLAESRSHAGNPADVLGAGALAALLGAALDEVRQENALARVQKADALRAVELVGRKVEKVKVETPIEITKESAQDFLDLAKQQGKVIENE